MTQGRKVRQALLQGTERLVAAGVESPQRDARRLLEIVLELEPGRLVLHLDDIMDANVVTAFFDCILKREDRIPMSHITGKRAFFGRDFLVTRDVLDPRPETETLIEQALGVPFGEVLDLGTGSGAIAVSLLAERPGATGIVTDISRKALEVAERNAKTHGVADRLGFLESDWFDWVEGQFDLIVSNPPYIAADEMTGLAPELSHEPRMALTDEGDGLSAYRAITAGAPAHLTQGGRLMVEIGPTQGAAVTAMFRDAGLGDVQTSTDLDGRDRVVRGVRR